MIPFRVAMPVRAINPTIEAIEMVRSEKNQIPKTAPIKASGMFSMTWRASERL